MKNPHSSPRLKGTWDPLVLLELQKRVLKLRYEQLKMNEMLKMNAFPGLPVHLSIGHEVLATCIANVKQDGDLFCLSHRNLAYNLALGADFDTVCDLFHSSLSPDNKSLAGSMNFFDPDIGSIYSSSILGNNLPVAAGAALSESVKNSQQSVVFAITGDGAIEEGAFWETLLITAATDLPLIIIVENNNFSLGSTITNRRKQIDLHLISQGLGASYFYCDSFDLTLTLDSLDRARTDALQNLRPVVVEATVNTFCNHAGPTPGWPADPKSITLNTNLTESWFEGDPISQIKKDLGVIAFEQFVNELMESRHDG